MAQLPTSDSLGARPDPVADTAISQVSNAGAPDAALAGVGNAISQIGDHLTKVRRAADLTNAMGSATEELGALADKYSRDQDYATSPTRFKMDASAIGNKYANQLSDPVVQEVFKNEYTKLAAAHQLGQIVSASKQERDFNVANLNSNLTTYAEGIAKAPDSLAQQQMANMAKISIGEMKTSGWITDVDAERMSQSFDMRTQLASVMGDMNADPGKTAERLASDPGYAPKIDELTRQRLLYQAGVRERVNAGKQVGAEKDAIQATQLQFVAQMAVGKLSVNDVLQSNLPAVGEGSQEHFLNLMRSRANEVLDRPVKTIPTVALGLFANVHAPDGDPNKITSTAPIENAYLNRQLSFEDMSKLRREVIDAKSPDGEKLGTKQSDFIKGIGAQIDHSNPMMGKIDETGKQKLYEFNDYVGKQVDAYKQSGKNPHDLFDPSKPDYLGKPEAIKPYQTSLTQSLNTFTRNMNGVTGLGPVAAPAGARKPGESIADYMKRSGMK